MTLPYTPISLSNVGTEIGQGNNYVYTNLAWVGGNSKNGAHNLNAIEGEAWFQSDNLGNCNNGNCNCQTTQVFQYSTTANCNAPTTNCNSVQNCVNCLNCTTINCTNCDSRAWLQANCNCACTYNCTPTTVFYVNCNCVINCNCCTCFIAGTLVLMADFTWKRVEAVQIGDYVMGVHKPERVKDMDIVILGPERKLRTIKETGFTWSEEHCFWGKQNQKEWFWSARKPAWLNEVRQKAVVGFKDNSTLMEGEGFEFATLDGFKKQEITTIQDSDPLTPLYLPITNGSPIIVAGYVAEAYVDEFGFDYHTIDWERDRQRILEGLNRAQGTK